MTVNPSTPAAWQSGELVAVAGADWIAELITATNDPASGPMVQVRFPFTLRNSWIPSAPALFCGGLAEERIRYPVARPCRRCLDTARRWVPRVERYCLACHDPHDSTLHPSFVEVPSLRIPTYRDDLSRHHASESGGRA